MAIEFNQYTVQLVLGFKQSDNRFKYSDTHNGRSWRYTNPLSEQEACKEFNDNSNGFFCFCHSFFRKTFQSLQMNILFTLSVLNSIILHIVLHITDFNTIENGKDDES